MGVMNMCLFSGEMEPSPDNEQRQMIIVANSKVVHFDAHLSSINSKGNFSRRSQSYGTLTENFTCKCICKVPTAVEQRKCSGRAFDLRIFKDFKDFRYFSNLSLAEG